MALCFAKCGSLDCSVAISVGDAEPSPVFLAVRVAECCSYLSNFDELFVQLLDELLVWWM